MAEETISGVTAESGSVSNAIAAVADPVSAVAFAEIPGSISSGVVQNQAMVRIEPDSGGPAEAAGRLDEFDLRVVNALQVAPRAPWKVLARGVGADPGTVARRWERLRERGLAWTAVYPGLVSGAPGALVDLVCEPRRLDDVVRELSADPECVSLDITSGERNLMLSVRAADERSLTRYVLDRVGELPGVLSSRVHLVVGSPVEGGMWRLRALDRSEAGVLRSGYGVRSAEAAGEVYRRPWFWDLVAALTPDGRASYEQVGRAMGVSATSARRWVGEALGSGALLMRCEVARSFSGWPVCAWYLAKARSEALAPGAAALATVPEVRAVITAAGPVNLLAGVWLRSLEQVPRLETLVQRKITGIEVVERCVVIRPVKQVGHLLREDGTSRGIVPIVLRPGTATAV